MAPKFRWAPFLEHPIVDYVIAYDGNSPVYGQTCDRDWIQHNSVPLNTWVYYLRYVLILDDIIKNPDIFNPFITIHEAKLLMDHEKRQAKKFVTYPVFRPVDMVRDEILRGFHIPLTDMGQPMPSCQYKTIPKKYSDWFDQILAPRKGEILQDQSVDPWTFRYAAESLVKDSSAGFYTRGTKENRKKIIFEQCDRLDDMIDDGKPITWDTITSSDEWDLMSLFFNVIDLMSRHEVGRRLRKIMAASFIASVWQRRFSGPLLPFLKSSNFVYGIPPQHLDAIVNGVDGLVENGFKYSFMADYTNYGEITDYDTWRLTSYYLMNKFPLFNWAEFTQMIELNFLMPRLAVPSFGRMLSKSDREVIGRDYPEIFNSINSATNVSCILEPPNLRRQHDSISGQDWHNMNGHLPNILCQLITADEVGVDLRDWHTLVNLDDNATFFKYSKDRDRTEKHFPEVAARLGMDINPGKSYFGTNAFLISQVIHAMKKSDESWRCPRTLTAARALGKTIFSERMIGFSTPTQVKAYEALALTSRFQHINPIQAEVYMSCSYGVSKHVDPLTILKSMEGEEFNEFKDFLKSTGPGRGLLMGFDSCAKDHYIEMSKAKQGLDWISDMRFDRDYPIYDMDGDIHINDKTLRMFAVELKRRKLDAFGPVWQLLKKGSYDRPITDDLGEEYKQNVCTTWVIR